MSSDNHYSVYDPFAWFYDRYWGNSFSKDARPIVQRLLLPHLPAGGSILDLCCGTGQFAHWLTGCGFRVTGLDGSIRMLRLARKNAPDARFVVADARRFWMPPVHAAVVSTFDSLNHVPSSDSLREVFQNVRACLKEDGLFLFDMNTDEGFRATAPETHAVIKKNHACIVKSEYNTRSGIASSEVTLFERRDGGWLRSDLEILEYLHPEDEVRAALATAGFQRVEVYDAEQDLGMKRGAGRLFFLAAKGRVRQEAPPGAEGKPL